MRSLAKRPGAAVLRLYTRTWKPRSRLILVPDGQGWSIDEDVRQLAAVAARLGLRVRTGGRWARHSSGQMVFWASQFSLLVDDWLNCDHRHLTAFFHGLPGSGNPEFDALFERVGAHRHRLHAVQTTHPGMEEALARHGMERNRIFRIPIGIDPTAFAPVSPEERRVVREELGIPADAFVVGSFQKDGVGWGDGAEPKLIKGPDLLVETLRRLATAFPHLVVLLTGPARGYVRAGLEASGIAVRHRDCPDLSGVVRAYAALDAYLVSSRQEGGPKAVLESMARGIPLVSSEVGQATVLVRTGENGWLYPVGDTGRAAALLEEIAAGRFDRAAVRAAGRATAEAHSHHALAPHWQRFFAFSRT